MELHSFYCIKCGKEGIPCFRKTSNLRHTFHKKKLYCIYCQKETNHVECRNKEEIQEFKSLFNKGYYKQEATQYV